MSGALVDFGSYRVEGGAVKLDRWDPRDRAGVNRDDAEARMEGLRARMAKVQERLYAEARRSVLVVLQARDAGGKDGTVKHVFSGLNPQGVQVANFKVPTAEEAAHDFLWRVHLRAPAAGMLGIFNRSHYEDVLVPRVHGGLDAAGVARRYRHIRAFEELLADRGTVLLKLHLLLSREEQAERLQSRLDEPDKRWKFNPGDLTERARWDEYTAAYEDMLEHTATPEAPWYVVPADRKWFRNLFVSELLVATLEAMDLQPPVATFDPAEIRVE